MQRITLRELLSYRSPLSVHYQATGQSSFPIPESSSSKHPSDDTRLIREETDPRRKPSCSSLEGGCVLRTQSVCVSSSKKRERSLDGDGMLKKLKRSCIAKEGVSSGDGCGIEELLPHFAGSIRVIGRLQLWNSNLHVSVCSLKSDCLAFVDDTATICCLVKNIDPQVLGCLVQLVSWNYIPVKDGGACLEIQRFELAEESSVVCKPGTSFPSLYLSPGSASIRDDILETPPSKQNLGRIRLAVAGCVLLISPPFAIPRGESRGSNAARKLLMEGSLTSKILKASIPASNVDVMQNAALDATVANVTKPLESMQGFLLELSVCEHSASCASPKLEHCRTIGQGNNHAEFHARQEVAYVFFSGTVAAWRPILSSALGQCMAITGLRRKVLLVGAERKQYRVYVATRTTIISLLRSSAEKSDGILLGIPKTKVEGKVETCIDADFQDCERNHLGRREDCTSQCRLKAGALLTQPTRTGNACGERVMQGRLVLPLSDDHSPCGMQVGSYIGIVTGMFVRGGLVELDGCVWLLLTHQPLSQVHGLRVGAMVAARHVHMVKVTSLLEKALLLGACFRSHVVVVCFSPLKTLYAGWGTSRSRLSSYIESLSFLSAFWALQIIASFRQKFRGLYSDKEILGSMKNEGIAQKYISNLFDIDTTHSRDILKEFFSHDKFCCLAEPLSSKVSPEVPPIGNLCKQVQIYWQDPNSLIWQTEHKVSQAKEDAYSTQAAAWKKWTVKQDIGVVRNFFFRRMISSKQLGVTLLGFLKFSRVSGRLQLLDASGALDVVVPDLQSGLYFEEAYQVTSFDLVVEGFAGSSSRLIQDKRSLPLSWSNILRGTKFKMEVSYPVSFFVLFFIKEAYLVQLPRQFGPDVNLTWQGRMQQDTCTYFEAARQERAKFNILLVIHKYPLRSKFSKQTDASQLSFSVEAVIIPYHVSILNECEGEAQHQKPRNAQDFSAACSLSILFRSREHEKAQQMLNRVSAIQKGGQDGIYAYAEFICTLEKENLGNGSQMRRVLLQFTDQCVQYHQVIQIGQCYLVHSLPDSSTTVTIHAGSEFWSLAAESLGDGKITVMEKMDAHQLTDAILKVPTCFSDAFNNAIEKARTFVTPVLGVREVIDDTMAPGKCTHLKERGFITGALVSFRGMVEGLQSSDLPTLARDELICSKHVKGSSFLHRHMFLYVKDLESSQTVKVACDFHRYAFPIGLGPGAVVSFHRALVQWSAIGAVLFRCVPSTLIVVCSVQESSFLTESRTLDICAGSWIYQRCKKHEGEATRVHAILDCVTQSTSIIKCVKVHCRVIAVEKLVLQRQGGLDGGIKTSSQFSSLQTSKVTESLNCKVVFASFLVDDGSGVAQCWATDEKAAFLLSFPVLAGKFRDSFASSATASSSVTVVLAQQLNALVEKYGSVTLQNGSCQLEFASDCVMIRGGKDGILSYEEEKLMHAIVQRACHAGPLVLLAECRPGVPEVKELGGEVNEFKYDKITITNGGQKFQTITNNRLHLFARKVEPINYERYLETLTEELSSLI